MLVSFDKVAFGYGDNLIFGGAAFSINEGERIGLIGENGAGKTTLIKLMLGRLEADAGKVFIKNGLKCGYLEQDGGYTSGNTVYGEMLDVFKEEISAVEKLSSLSAKLAAADGAEYASLAAEMERLNKFISARGCFDVEVKIKTVLNGMGFACMYDRIIDTMSGGEKTRMKLARLLLEEPDLLILDEPTNHLDISTLFWLEEYLQSFGGAVFVVSHDRYFLDRIVKKTFELENKTLTCFNGNYTKYKVLKAELYARRLKEYEAQQEERAKLQDYVDRNIVRATTAKSAQSRVKQLEKMQLAEKPFTPPKPPEFNFRYDAQPYENVLEITDLNLERGGKRLINNGNLSLKRGQKLALTGENGAGKSTLLKEILNCGSCIKVGRFVKFAYYDQESANLGAGNTVLEELWFRHNGYTQTEARAALARCGLFAEDIQKPVSSLSGGERAKLALCILMCEQGNVLLLDEPTNHLDLPARESLEKALREFDGTLIFVSHDRYFVSAVAGCVAEIERGELRFYGGGYGEYSAAKKLEREKAASVKESAAAEREKERRENSYRSKKQRAEDERKKELAARIEKDISVCEREEEEINCMLAKPDVAADYVQVCALMQKLESVKNRLDALYKQYETVI